MHGTRHLSDAELAEIKRRRPGVRASLACEGMILTDEEERLIAQMDADRLGPEERVRRAIQYFEARHETVAVKAAR